jgi:hypothetical protein
LLGVRVAGLSAGDPPAAAPVAVTEDKPAPREAARTDQLALPV